MQIKAYNRKIKAHRKKKTAHKGTHRKEEEVKR